MDIINFLWRALNQVGSVVCHQLPERTIFLGKQALPVCARCTGIYLGVCICFLFLWARKRTKGNQPPNIGATIFLATCFLPFMLDGFFSYAGIWHTNNLLRLLSGFLAGCSFPVFLILAVHFQVQGKNDRPILENLWEIAFLFLGGFGISLWIYKGMGFPALFAGTMLVTGILCLWNTVIYLLLTLFFKQLQEKKGRIAAAGIMLIYFISVSSIKQW